MSKSNRAKVGSAKCDQTYNSIIERRKKLIQAQYKTISKRNAKINDLHAFLNELLEIGRIKKSELVARFKNPTIKLAEIESKSVDEDINPFFNTK